jgi:UDP-2,4-diacetamido-2,4,6-trideoxy-beta-L-altropyranose hydrolase
MRIVFRVDGSTNIGLGHLMRCIALAQALDEQGHQVAFIMSAQSIQFCQARQDWCGQLIPMPEMPLSAEPAWLHQQCLSLTTNWLVLDGYQFEQDYRQPLHCSEFNLAVFDDMNTSEVLSADLIINGANNAAQLNYQQTAPTAILAIGEQYQVLRQEFVQLTDRNWPNRQYLAVTFGGSDPTNLTLGVLQAFKTKQVDMPIKVITGAAYQALPELDAFIQSSGLDITHLHDCQNMAAELVTSKLTISAAGGSQFELLACATPALLVVVASNQQLATQHAATQGWCKVLNQNDESVEMIVKQGLSLWQQQNSLQTMHHKALQLPCINGADNIIQLMLAGQVNSGTSA